MLCQDHDYITESDGSHSPPPDHIACAKLILERPNRARKERAKKRRALNRIKFGKKRLKRDRPVISDQDSSSDGISPDELSAGGSTKRRRSRRLKKQRLKIKKAKIYIDHKKPSPEKDDHGGLNLGVFFLFFLYVCPYKPLEGLTPFYFPLISPLDTCIFTWWYYGAFNLFGQGKDDAAVVF